MIKKTLIISLLAAVLIMLASLSSVVGTNSLKLNDENKRIVSPLFTIRSQRSLNKESTKIVNSDYLGKSNRLNLFFLQKTSLEKWIDKALKIIDAEPYIFRLLVDKITLMPKIVTLLKNYDITLNDFKNQMYQVINNPSILKEKVGEVTVNSPFGNDPIPLGLSTSSALGCLIVVLIMGPILALIGAIIATMTIVTCLLPGCFEEFVGNLLDGFIQGLTPPNYS